MRDGGRTVTVSTINTRLHPPGGALHTGAKGALKHFTAVATLEFGGRKITVNTVSPGPRRRTCSPSALGDPPARNSPIVS
jgi:3-oxoacyl-[acyl-carrier protein] reductase